MSKPIFITFENVSINVNLIVSVATNPDGYCEIHCANGDVYYVDAKEFVKNMKRINNND